MSSRRAVVWLKRSLLFTGGVTAVAGGSLYAWMLHYERTKPPERQTRKLVDEQGQLLRTNITISTWRVCLRFVQLFFLYLPLVLSYPFTKFSAAIEKRWQEYFIDTVQNTGPAFIKLAQWLATRRDLASPPFRKLLSKLFNHVHPHDMAHNRKVIEEDLGKPIEEVFSTFDEEAKGSGSIAQVHRAVLKDGREVAVKISHPSVREHIAVDFHVINKLARWADSLFPSTRWLDLPRQAVAWTAHLAQQIDLRIEAENLEYFLENFKHCADSDTYATFPRPIRPYVSSRLLVEEYIDGETASDEYLTSLPMELRTHIAEVGMNTYCKFLLRDNWLHGDLHPGNIIIAKNIPEGKKHPAVYLVDCGLCQNLTAEEAKVSELVLSSFARWRPHELQRALWNMGPNGEQRYAKSDELLAHLNDVFEYYKPCKGDDTAIVGRMLESVFDVVRLHKVQLEPAYISLMFGVLVQENFIMTLDENFNIIKRVIPWLAAQGMMSKGMFKNYLNFFPDFLKNEDRTQELGPKLAAQGILSVEGDNHLSWEEERKKGKNKDTWKRGVLES